MNFERQETNEDFEQKRGVRTLSNDIEANSNASSNTKIAQCFDSLASQYDSENEQKYYNPKQSASSEDVLAKFDSSGIELYSKYKENIKKNNPVDKISFPPHPFSHYLKKNPESILAIITDNTDRYLSLKEIHLIKSEFENKIDMIPLDSRLPKIQRSLYYYGYFLLQCMDDFTKNWIIDNFRGNKNVIEGKVINILNATELPNTIDKIYISESEKMSFKRVKFFNRDWKLKNCSSADNSNENSIFSTTLKDVQTLHDSNAEPTSSVFEETSNVKIEPDWMPKKNYDSDNKNSISSNTFKNVQALSSKAEPASSGSEEITSVKIEPDWTPEKDDNSDKNSISNGSMKVLQALHNSNAEPASFEFEKSTNVRNEEFSDTIEHPAINSYSGENFEMNNNHEKTIQDYEQNDNVQEASIVLKDAKRGLMRSQILKLKLEYEKKLKEAIFLLKKKNQTGKNNSPPDSVQKILTKSELRKLKRKCLKKLKHLKQLLANLNIECKKNKNKKRKEKEKNSVDSNKELSSNTCKVNTVDGIFSYINSSKHIRNSFLKYCVIDTNHPTIRKKFGEDIKLIGVKELKSECIKNLEYFRVRFNIYYTNSTDTRQFLNRLDRFNPELGCLNWHVLSKYTHLNHIRWIFIVKPNGIEALRKAKFIGYTGIDRINFRIVIGHQDILKYLESRAQKSGVIGSSSDNNESIPALTDQMDTVESSSAMADSKNKELSDMDYDSLDHKN